MVLNSFVIGWVDFLFSQELEIKSLEASRLRLGSESVISKRVLHISGR
jgi:hypothetical protein